MACPAVRLSVEIRHPARLYRLEGGRRMLILGLPRCSDEDDCDLIEGPSCLLPMLRDVPAARSGS
jgi:hypothetical protein